MMAHRSIFCGNVNFVTVPSLLLTMVLAGLEEEEAEEDWEEGKDVVEEDDNDTEGIIDEGEGSPIGYTPLSTATCDCSRNGLRISFQDTDCSWSLFTSFRVSLSYWTKIRNIV